MSNRYTKIIFGSVLTLLVLVTPYAVDAESVIWSSTIRQTFENNGSKGRWTVINPTIYVRYNTRVVNRNTGTVIPCGSSVPQGTTVRFEMYPHYSSDIAWFATGGIYDSPYGSWSETATRSGGTCADRNLYFRVNLGPTFGGIVDYYADFAVRPPAKSITGLPSNICYGSGTVQECATTYHTGALTAYYNFAATTGRFWGGYGYQKKCVALDNNGLMSGQVQVGAQGHACRINVTVPPPQSPNNPVVTGNACVTGTAAQYTAVSSHPGRVSVRYLFDWDNNGTADQVVPGSGYVAPGVVQTVSHTWATPSAKQFKVMAQDAQGKLSGWTTHNVPACTTPNLPGDVTGTTSVTPTQLGTTTPTVVTPTPDPTPVDPATLWSYPPGDGPVGVINATVNPRLTNTTCKLSWTTEHVTECKVYLQNQLVADVLVRGERDVEPGTYTVRCRQLKDNTIIQSLPQSCVWNPGVREI
jgi:hypothetical protein